MSAQLICYDCHIRRRVIAPVIEKITRENKEIDIVRGYRCKKCVQKLYVIAEKSTHCRGWKMRFNSLVKIVQDNARKKMMPQSFEDEKSHVINDSKPYLDKLSDDKTKKPNLINKISSFFRRRSM